MVSFNSVPSSLRVPFVTAEFDASRAAQGPALLAYRALLIGQKITAGTGTADALYRVTSADDVVTYAGRGSMLHRMALAYFAANKSTETWIGVLADDGSGVAATGTMTVTGPATAAGTLALYIGGTLVRVAVTSGMTANQCATAIGAAVGLVGGSTNLPVYAAVSTNVVTLHAKNKGECGNDIDVRLNYQGEKTPAGIAVAIVGMASGATNPDLDGLIATLGDQWFHVLAHPYTDATSLTALEAELSSRNGPLRMVDGVAITATALSYSSAATLGDSRNSPHNVIVRAGRFPTPPMEVAAHLAGVVAYHSAIDPARPLQTLPLPWIKAPADADRDTLEERNLLLYDGISTMNIAAGDLVQIERLITTYQENASGSEDTAYLSVETLFTLMYARFSFRARMSSRYPRHKLANDGTRFASGQAVMTPKLGRAEAIAWFRELEDIGLFEGFEQFKTDLVVERNVSDPNRLDFLLPPDLINMLVVSAAKVQFLL
jgi:phage tail sheath gpL-like